MQVPYLVITASYGYRNRGENFKATNNYSASVSYNKVPFINSSASAAYNYLSTNYLEGNIFNARVSKYFFDGVFNTTLGFRKIIYRFNYSSEDLVQNEILLDLGYGLSRMLTFSFSYEGTFEKIRTYNRVFLNLNSRF